MSKYETIFLDMDGVLCDWLSAVLELHGKTWVDYEEAGFDLEDCLGNTEAEMWELIDTKGGEAFWADLSPYPYLKDLVELAEKNADEVVILTSPHRHSTCFAGKYTWLENHLPNAKFVFTKWKGLCAKENTLLVDDWYKNIDDFRAAGGDAVLIPKPWNAKSFDYSGALEVLSDYLKNN